MAATLFMLHAVQSWGQSEEQIVAAVQGVLDAAHFDAVATGNWYQPCTGTDADTASKWLVHAVETMPRGEMNAEIQYIKDAIAARAEGWTDA